MKHTRNYIFVAVFFYMILGFFLMGKTIHAQTEGEKLGLVNVMPFDDEDYIEAYMFYKDVPKLTTRIPAVVDIPLLKDSIGDNFKGVAIYDNTEDKFVYSNLLYKNSPIQPVLTILSSPQNQNIRNVLDKDPLTYAEFEVPETGEGEVTITITSEETITSSYLDVTLDQNVATPDEIDIKISNNNNLTTLVENRQLLGRALPFPKSSANTWIISIRYSQLLRVNELKLVEQNPTYSKDAYVRMLFQPNHSYSLYMHPDRVVRPYTPNQASLRNVDENEVISLEYIPPKENPRYKPADQDGDGIPDTIDNCFRISNPNQENINNNEFGDACEDFDKDGRLNARDNCPDTPNPRQMDGDNDGVGDACDSLESRLTERYPWIPWTGIGFAAIVLIAMFVATSKHALIEEDSQDNKSDNNSVDKPEQ